VRQGLVRLLSLASDTEVVAEAGDGDEARNVIRRTAPDVVLLDVRMPRASGLDLLEYLSEVHVMKNVTDSRRRFLKVSSLTAGAFVVSPSFVRRAIGAQSDAGVPDYTLHIKKLPNNFIGMGSTFQLTWTERPRKARRLSRLRGIDESLLRPILRACAFITRTIVLAPIFLPASTAGKWGRPTLNRSKTRGVTTAKCF